jgi:hypothetical protein
MVSREVTVLQVKEVLRRWLVQDRDGGGRLRA